MFISGCTARKEMMESEWVSLFNGRDLSGWIPKISGYPLGENYKHTFIVRDSAIEASYAEYDTFRNEFGHLFYETPFRFYRLKMEYRFIGEPTPGAPEWAQRNNGVMIISQSPQSMGMDQDFPVSIEVQFLGGLGKGNRPTGNLCTPGYHVTVQDTLATEHCMSSSSNTYDGDQWVEIEVAIMPDSTIYHLVEGDTVFIYRKPVIGGDFLPEGYPLNPGTPVIEGYIALQAESHRTAFRNIRIQKIE
jgi:hypothetical protein